MVQYQIRVEMPESKYFDFTVLANHLPDARRQAEGHIKTKVSNGLPRIQWRGQVAFVNRNP